LLNPAETIAAAKKCPVDVIPLWQPLSSFVGEGRKKIDSNWGGQGRGARARAFRTAALPPIPCHAPKRERDGRVVGAMDVLPQAKNAQGTGRSIRVHLVSGKNSG